MGKKHEQVSLDDIAERKLSDKLIRAIDEVEVRVKPDAGFSFRIDQRTIEIVVCYEFSTKRFLGWAAGITTSVGGLVAILRVLLPLVVGQSPQP